MLDRLPLRPAAPSDDRAVSEVLGSILIFGLLVAVLVVVQATAVPSENQQVEYEHSIRVQGDLLTLDDQVAEAAVTDSDQVAVVETGVRYPSRMLLVNPGPAAGTVRTEPGRVTVENARASGETADYWDGTAREFDTRALTYRADYNVYRNAPVTRFEHGVLVNRYEGADQQLDDGQFVNGRRVSLVTLDGDRSVTRVRQTSLQLDPLSPYARTITVQDDDDPIRLTLSTALPADVWRRVLSEELVANGGHVQSVTGGPGDTVRVTLEPGVSYELRVAEVGVGEDATPAPAAYLAAPDRQHVSTAAGTPVPLTAEVRDELNAPVSGVDVTFSATDGSLAASTVTSDLDGHATVEYTPASAGTSTVTAEADLDGSGSVEADERVTFTVSTAAAGGGGGGGSGGGGAGATRTVGDEGDHWTVSNADGIELADPTFSSLTGTHDEVSTEREYLRATFVVSKGETRYLLEVGDSADGLVRKTDGTWERRTVTVYRRTGDESYQRVQEATLKRAALENLYQGRRSIDLLAQQNYEEPTPRLDGLADLQSFMSSNTDVEVYLDEFDGRATVTVS